jgi:CheY-like chemotaxis protein
MSKRILLIDDCKHVRLAIAEVLELLGYDVTACSEEDYMQALHASYDIILCDHNLGQIKGTDVYQILHTFPHLANTPFLVLTGSTESAVGEYSGLSEANVLAKPFPIDEFEQRLELLVH